MTSQGPSTALKAGSDEEIRAQLDRILVSRAFRQADRTKRFFAFIVNETLSGRGDQLKEFLIGVEVFERDPSFDPRTDPLVRVQARRLRARLATYYREEGQADEIRIELPKGSYAPLFKRAGSHGSRRSTRATIVNHNTVLVLPFADCSQDGDEEYFCKGVAHEIVDNLCKMQPIRVLAWEQVLESQNNDFWEAADRSNAGLIITGSVRKLRDQLRVTSHIIDAVSSCYLWSESIDRSPDDAIRIQEEVARTIASWLKTELLDSKSVLHASRSDENVAANNFYLQGRYHLDQRTEEGLRKGVQLFEKAIVEDAQYANAYSGLSDAYSLLGHYAVISPADVWTKVPANAATAVLLNVNSAEAHTSIAHAKSTQDWDWLGAEREFQHAIHLHPEYATAHHWYGISCLAPLGRLDEALQELLLAQNLAPVSSIIARDLAMIYYYKRDFGAALEQCDHAIDLNPHFSVAYWALGLIQEQRKDFDEAAAAFERAAQLSPTMPRMRSGLARIFALSGKQKHARRILAELEDLATRRYVSPFEMASINFALNETDRGFEWLTKAFQDRCFELISIKIDPRFDSLTGDSRFISLSSQLGLD